MESLTSPLPVMQSYDGDARLHRRAQQAWKSRKEIKLLVNSVNGEKTLSISQITGSPKLSKRGKKHFRSASLQRQEDEVDQQHRDGYHCHGESDMACLVVPFMPPLLKTWGWPRSQPPWVANLSSSQNQVRVICSGNFLKLIHRHLAHFRKYSLNSHRYSKFSINRRFCRKREAWLSVVAENAELNFALSS